MQDLAAEGHLTADVLARLDREKRYGIWSFNRSHKTQKRVAVDTPNGREYKTPLQERAPPPQRVDSGPGAPTAAFLPSS